MTRAPGRFLVSSRGSNGLYTIQDRPSHPTLALKDEPMEVMRPKPSSTRRFRLGRSVRRWGACLVLATTFWPAARGPARRGPWTSAARSCRSSPTTASSATGRTPRPARPAFGSTSRSRRSARRDPVIVPGKGDESEVILRVTSRDPDEVMPPPQVETVADPRAGRTAEALDRRGGDVGETLGLRAAATVRAPGGPGARLAASIRSTGSSWPGSRRRGCTPRPRRERATLIRRVTLDLTGLPPTPAEVDAFLADPAPDAYETVVDRLLASPHYGERMAWDWLDAARYADTNGYQGDARADHVALARLGDRGAERATCRSTSSPSSSSPATCCPARRREQKLATGFCRNHMINGEGGRIAEENRVDYVMDQAETAGDGLARPDVQLLPLPRPQVRPAHPARLLRPLRLLQPDARSTGGGGDRQTPPVIELRHERAGDEARGSSTHSLREAVKAVEAMEQKLFPRAAGKPASDSPKATVLKPEIVALLKVPAGQRDRGQLEQLEKHWAGRRAAYAALLKSPARGHRRARRLRQTIPRVMVMEDMPKPRETFLLVRGSYEKPAEKVTPDVPARSARRCRPARRGTGSAWPAGWSRRDNPLTARVTVNRAWQQFFGIGLVKTPEDFGVQGETPVAPRAARLAGDGVRPHAAGT